VQAQVRTPPTHPAASFSRLLFLVAAVTIAIVYGGLSVFGDLTDAPSGGPEVIPPPRQAADP
jgi:hypothetical protein